MTVQYPYLAAALLLLWFPRQWMRFGPRVIKLPRYKRPTKDEREPGDISVKYIEEFAQPRNWVDWLRAITGSYAVMLFSFQLEADASKDLHTAVFAIQAAILLIALLIQTVRIEGRLTLFAPLFFVLGLGFGLIGWKASVFCVVGIWALNLTLPSASVFLFVFGGLQLCFGLLLGYRFPAVIAASVLSMLPVLLSAVTKRRLVKFNKKNKVVTRSRSGAGLT